MGTAIDRAAEAVQQGGVRAALAANAAVLSAQAQLDNVRLQSELAFAEHASALAAADTSLDGHVADRLTARTFLQDVQAANRAAEQARSAAANSPATRAAAWRAKFTDSRKGLKEYFEEVEEERFWETIQRVLDTIAMAASFIPGVGWLVAGGVELGNAGISVYRDNAIDAASRLVFAAAGPVIAKGAAKVVGAAGRGILSVGRKAAASRAGQFLAGGVRLACRGFSKVGTGARKAWRAASGSGGRLGNRATREHVAQVAAELKRRGWRIIGGGGKRAEEYLPGLCGTRFRSNWVDITATKAGRILRINTIDTLADGITPTAREALAALRIRAKTGGHLLLVPKPR